MREHLLGYVLGALDASEQAELEARLAADPELRRELEEVRATLAPLDDDDTDPAPPPGMAERTCRYVCSYAGWLQHSEASPSSGAWRAQDVLVAAGVFVAASMLIFPAISSSVSGSRRMQCQNNLRVLGMALGQYSDHHGGLFPFVPPKGNFGVAGIYAPILYWGGYLQRPCQILCPEASTQHQRNDYTVPTPEEISRADHVTLRIIQVNIGGNYGYHPGNFDQDGVYHCTRNRGRTYFAIVADAPGCQAGSGSPNHGNRGQNVLFENGRVVFQLECRVAESGDDIYTNLYGLRGAGGDEDDSSISPSDTPPLVHPVALPPR